MLKFRFPKTFARGWWENNALHGQASIRYSNGTTYFGKCKNNKRHGFGEFRKDRGTKEYYLGHFYENDPHGTGSKVFMLTTRGEAHQDGMFHRGKFIGFQAGQLKSAVIQEFNSPN